jgi:hypothetical protein
MAQGESSPHGLYFSNFSAMFSLGNYDVKYDVNYDYIQPGSSFYDLI